MYPRRSGRAALHSAPRSPQPNVPLKPRSKLFSLFIRSLELGPGIALHVLQDGALPVKFWVRLQKLVGDEILSAGITGPSLQAHGFRHCGVRRLGRYCAPGRIWWPLPFGHATRRVGGMATEGTLVAVLLVFVAVSVVGEKLLGHLDIDLPLALRHQFLPAFVTGIGRAAHVAGIEIGIFLNEVRVAGKV